MSSTDSSSTLWTLSRENGERRVRWLLVNVHSILDTARVSVSIVTSAGDSCMCINSSENIHSMSSISNAIINYELLHNLLSRRIVIGSVSNVLADTIGCNVSESSIRDVREVSSIMASSSACSNVLNMISTGHGQSI